MRGIPSLAILGCFIACAGLAGPVGCVDAPITPDQLEADGRLREQQGHAQAAFAAQKREDGGRAVQMSAVLAAQPTGALQDRTEFPADVGTVHLHVRADGLLAPRPVVYRWTHDDIAVLEPGVLAPTGTLSLGASFDIEPDLVGHWEVDVLASPEGVGEAPRVLFHREFEVRPGPA